MTQLIESRQAQRFDNLRTSHVDGLGGVTVASLDVNKCYFNSLRTPVTIVMRSGLSFLITPSVSRSNKDFVVKESYTYGSDVIPDVRKLLHEVNEDSSSYQKALKAAIDNRSERVGCGKTRFAVEHRFSEEELGSHGGSIYVPELDIVISILAHHMVPPHPYSCEGNRRKMITEDDTINRLGVFGYSIRIIDNKGVFGNRYVNMSGECFKVAIVKDINLRDGVYVTSSGLATGDHYAAPPRCNFYTLEEADKELKLYRSYEEAMTLGDVYAAKERELEEFRLQVKREEEELKRRRMQREEDHKATEFRLAEEKAELERRERELEQETTRRMTELKEQQAALDHARQIELIKTKSHYETRSLRRKDTSEAIKFIPALIGGGLGLWAVLRAL